MSRLNGKETDTDSTELKCFFKNPNNFHPKERKKLERTT